MVKQILEKVEDYEAYAENSLTKSAKDYYNLGSCAMETLLENKRVFTRIFLLPRFLVDVSNVNLSISLFGSNISCPIGVAPAAMQSMAHEDGEVAVARACSRLNMAMGLSSQSTKSIEDVSTYLKSEIRIFQLYVYKDRNVTLNLVKRAEKCGFTAVAITVDRPVLGKREAEARNKFALPPHLSLANFSTGLFGGTDLAETSNLGAVRAQVDDSLDWTFLDWLRQHTSMKIALKGILTVEDAVAAVHHGVDAIWISNHGGRQLDCTPSAVDMLPEIRAAIQGSNARIFVDGGFRRGTDVLKVIGDGILVVQINQCY